LLKSLQGVTHHCFGDQKTALWVSGYGKNLLLDSSFILQFKSVFEGEATFVQSMDRLMCAETPSQNSSSYVCSVQTIPK